MSFIEQQDALKHLTVEQKWETVVTERAKAKGSGSRRGSTGAIGGRRLEGGRGGGREGKKEGGGGQAHFMRRHTYKTMDERGGGGGGRGGILICCLPESFANRYRCVTVVLLPL